MAAPPSPVAIANAIARNVVPLGGILFLGWPAASVLVLYFADTLFVIAVIFAGLMRHFLPPPKDEGWAARANAEVGYVGAALLLVAFFAVPLGIPLIFMLAGTDVTVRSLFAEEGFRAGLVLQGIAAFWSGRDLYRALQQHTPEELRLKRQFSLVFLRWMAVLMASYMGFAYLLGQYAPYVFIIVYIVATIFIDVAPDKFLRAMPGGAVDADPLPGEPPKRTVRSSRPPPRTSSPPSAPSPAAPPSRRRRKHRK